MIAYRCQCGNLEAISSMSYEPCHGCEECGTVPAPIGMIPPKAIEHDWQRRYDEVTGLPYEKCARCGKVKRAAWR